jgi:hypothetical protein
LIFDTEYADDVVADTAHGSEAEQNGLDEGQSQVSSATSMVQRTLALIKPDAYSAGKKEDIIALIEARGFRIVEQKEVHRTKEEAETFYEEHRGKPFFDDLTTWMSR